MNTTIAMKQNLNSFLILCSVFLCSACGNSSANANTAVLTEDSLYQITIRPPDMDTLQDLYLSEIADSVYYVALSDKPLLGNIRQLETTYNSIILSDGPRSSLKLYDYNGNFKRTIGDIGRGSGEYIQPTWTVNKKTDTVYLEAPFVRPNMLSIYSLSDDSDGKMIRRNRTKFAATWLHSLGDNLLGIGDIVAKSVPELRLYNLKTSTTIDSLPNYYNAGRTVVNPYRFAKSKYKDELYYMNVYSDTLYRVSEKEIAPFAIFDFGKYKLPIEMTSNDLNWDIKKNILNSTIKLESMLMTYNVLYLKFWNEEDVSFIYALNLDDKTGRYCKGYFINDLDNGPDYVGAGGLLSGMGMQIIDVVTLKVLLDDEVNSDKWRIGIAKDRLFPNNKMAKKMKNVDEFQRLLDNSTEESNSIIQLLKLKK